jgi:hypothetical protein
MYNIDEGLEKTIIDNVLSFDEEYNQCPANLPYDRSCVNHGYYHDGCHAFCLRLLPKPY